MNKKMDIYIYTHTHTMEYYSAVKRNKSEPAVVKLMNLETVIKIEVS